MRLLIGIFALAATAAPASPGFRYERTTPDAEVGLTIDRAIGRWPELHRHLWREDRAQLSRFEQASKSGRQELVESGFAEAPAFSHEISWKVSAAGPKLVSLVGTWYDYSGGAHPNHGYRALLWHTAAKREMKRAELFRPASSADAAIDEALCRGVNDAREEKGLEPDETWPCPKFRDAEFALLPANAGGGFGGFLFLFDPYEIGSYAEGEYEVVLPQSVVRPVLSPAWAGAFAGEPKPPKPKD